MPLFRRTIKSSEVAEVVDHHLEVMVHHVEDGVLGEGGGEPHLGPLPVGFFSHGVGHGLHADKAEVHLLAVELVAAARSEAGH